MSSPEIIIENAHPLLLLLTARQGFSILISILIADAPD